MPVVTLDSPRRLGSRRVFTCEHDGETLTLLGCTVTEQRIWPELIVSGRMRAARFKSFSILLSGVSDWMNDGGGFRISENEIARPRTRRHVGVDIVRSKSRDFRFESEEWVSVSRVRAGERVVRQQIAFTLSAIDGEFTAAELMDLAHGARTLFSLILGFRLDIESMWHRTRTGSRAQVYFANDTRQDDPFEHSIHCFSRSEMLFSGDAWPRLLRGFYAEASAEERAIWSRMAGLLRRDGTWEQQILAHVSLVDRYSDELSRGRAVKFAKDEWRGIKRSIRSAFDQAVDVNGTAAVVSEPADPMLVESVRRQIAELANTQLRTFREKFHAVIGDTPLAVRQVVDLSAADFAEIKTIRDKVAHGDEPRTREPGDVTAEFGIAAKLYILLLFWCFRTLGFEDAEFAECLTNSLSPVVRAASLDHLALDRETGRYPFLQIGSKDAYRRIRSCRPGTSVVIDRAPAGGGFVLNRRLTRAVRSWVADADESERSIEAFVANRIAPRAASEIGYLSGAYFEFDGAAHLAYGVCVLNPGDLAGRCHRVIEREPKSGLWNGVDRTP